MTIQRIESAAPPAADAQAIEKQLLELWRQVGASDKPMIRARVMTLVIVSPAEREGEMVELAMKLAERHPARHILLQLGDTEGEEALDAEATLLCGMYGHSLCAEQIRLRATGDAWKRLPGAVRSLLTADLPVVLFWTVEPGKHQTLFERLTRLADRTFIDTIHLRTPDLLGALEEPWRDRKVSDLNWSRLTEWREIIAQFFDPPAQRPLLAQLTEVEIQTGECPVGGWLLASWLADRLEWSFEERSPQGATLQGADGHEIKVAIQATDQPCAINGVVLRGESFDLTIGRSGRSGADCQLSVEDRTKIQEIVNLTDESEAALLSRELDLMGRDRIYEEALATLREWLR